MRRTLSRTVSTDREYIKRVLTASEEFQDDISRRGKVTVDVRVPSIAKQQTSEERKDVSSNMTMDELLSQYENDLGIDPVPDNSLLSLNEERTASIAAEVNLLKQSSEQILEVALKKEQSLSQGDSIDKYMPLFNVIQAQSTIDDQRAREIDAIPKSDPDYEKKVKEIQMRAKQTLYKAMKTMNTHNEIVPQ